jgi:hypothetical protein
MFYINLPATAKIGDTVPVRINGDPARVTWRDKDTLVIEPNDDRGLRAFFCGSESASKSAIERRRDGAVIVSEIS